MKLSFEIAFLISLLIFDSSNSQSNVTYIQDGFYENPLEEGLDVNPSHILISRREGSFSGDVISTATNSEGRLAYILDKIREKMGPTIKSIEEDIFKLNRDRIIIGMANFIAAFDNMLFSTNGEVNLNKVPPGNKILATGHFLYGYGFSRPWQDVYEPPRLDCGLKDLQKTLDEYDFVNNPDPNVDKSILLYYSTEMNHSFKRNLYCISQRTGTNQEAKELMALVDLYTELQEEIIEANEAKYRRK